LRGWGLAGAFAVVLAVLGWAGGAAPARAEHGHGGGSGTDVAYYRSEVTAVEPRVAGLDVTVLPDGSLVTVANRTGRTVTVLGYAGEPYLRCGPGGVERNVVSVSALLNDAGPQTRLPASVAPAWRQLPSWRHAADGPVVTWRDYRVRMTTERRPPSIGHDPARAGTAFDWAIPITVDGSPALVRGRVSWTGQSLAASPMLPPLMLGGFLALLTSATVITVRRRRAQLRLPAEPLPTMSGVAALLVAVPALAGLPAAPSQDPRPGPAPAPSAPHHSGSCELAVGTQPLNGGYLATVLVFNRDRTMRPWRVSFELPEEVTVLAGWGAGIGRDGRTVIAEAPPWQQLMRPGDQVSIGLVATGPPARPGTVILNDIACR
jgi:hypothetical protein